MGEVLSVEDFPKLELDLALYASSVDLRKHLELREHALEDGLRGLPLESDERLTNAEDDVLSYVNQAKTDLVTALVDRFNEVLNYLRGGSEQLDCEARKEQVTASVVRLFDEDSEIQSLADNVRSKEFIRNAFVHRHGRTEPAAYPDEILVPIAFVFVTILLEAGINAGFFAIISLNGTIGGIMLAIAASSTNVGLGLISGFVGWRLIGHQSAILRGVGYFTTAGVSIVAFFVNAGIANIRFLGESVSRKQDISPNPDFSITQYLSGQLLADATDKTFSLEIFAFETFTPWGLLFIGIAIFFLAAYKGWSGFADKYWGYKDVDYQHRLARFAFEHLVDVKGNSAEYNIESAQKEAKDIEESARKFARLGKSYADQSEALVERVTSGLVEWEDAARNAINFYRSENASSSRPAGTVPPADWSKPFNRDPEQPSIAEGHLMSAKTQLKNIHEVIDRLPAVAGRFSNDLTPFNKDMIALQNSIPERKKELHKVALANALTRKHSVATNANVNSGNEETQ